MHARLLNNRGATMIGVLVAAAILIPSTVFLLSGVQRARDAAAEMRDTVIAESYASELLEFFLSLDQDHLKEYLSINPMGAGSAYKYCAHINILDRANNILVNEDPIAALPNDLVLGLPQPGLQPNRYYQVTMVNLRTMESTFASGQKDYCNMVPTEASSPFPNDEWRFLVTVGVSWIPIRSDKDNAIKRVVLSGVVDPRL